MQNTWWAHVGSEQNWSETMDIGRKEQKKRTKLILFTSCEGPSLDRVWQFPTDSQQTIIIWRETDVSRGTGMCLNIICNLYIACVKCMCIKAGFFWCNCRILYRLYNDKWTIYASRVIPPFFLAPRIFELSAFLPFRKYIVFSSLTGIKIPICTADTLSGPLYIPLKTAAVFLFLANPYLKQGIG